MSERAFRVLDGDTHKPASYSTAEDFKAASRVIIRDAAPREAEAEEIDERKRAG